LNDEIGRLNYDAYRRERCSVLPNIPFDGWDDLLPAQQAAWNAGAAAVERAVALKIHAEYLEAELKRGETDSPEMRKNT
jgi:hypothetical protein